MKRSWSPDETPEPTGLMPAIGRAHLDQAHLEGRAAGHDPEKTVADCPYDSRANLMTIKAWETGFKAARSEAVASAPPDRAPS